MTTHQSAYFSKSGIALRVLAAEGDKLAIAEIQRRASKPVRTVAQAHSRGLPGFKGVTFAFTEPALDKPVKKALRTKGVKAAMLAELRNPASDMYPPEVRANAPQKAQEPASAPRAGRDTLKAVRADMAATNARIDALTASVADLATAVKSLVASKKR